MKDATKILQANWQTVPDFREKLEWVPKEAFFFFLQNLRIVQEINTYKGGEPSRTRNGGLVKPLIRSCKTSRFLL